MINPTGNTPNVPFHKVRVSRISSHALPYPLVHGFTLSSVMVDADQRVVNGGVHSRHLLGRSLTDLELWVQSTLLLTGHTGEIPTHVDAGSANDLGWVVGTLATDFARLMVADIERDAEFHNMAAANIALACLSAVNSTIQTDMFITYLQTVVGLFETEGAVSTILIYEVGDLESPTGLGHCSGGVCAPEETCKQAITMLFELISRSRLCPQVEVDGTLARRRAMSLMRQFERPIEIACQKFLGTINDRAPMFWAVDVEPEDDLNAMQCTVSRVIE